MAYTIEEEEEERREINYVYSGGDIFWSNINSNSTK
jgi:hypothetical protein